MNIETPHNRLNIRNFLVEREEQITHHKIKISLINIINNRAHCKLKYESGFNSKDDFEEAFTLGPKNEQNLELTVPITVYIE